MIERYESKEYREQGGIAWTIMVALGKINDRPYTYATLAPLSEVRPGTITHEFVEEAAVAFERAVEAA